MGAIVMLIRGFEKDILKLEKKEKHLKCMQKLTWIGAVLALVGWVVLIICIRGLYDSSGCEFFAIGLLGLIPLLFCVEHLIAVHHKLAHYQDIVKHFQEAEMRADMALEEE